MASFDRQPFASTHPAIDALFNREFSQRQLRGQEDIAGRQIDASSRLATAQLQQAAAQQDYANLFREREFQARQDAEKVRQGQIDRQLKIYESQVPNQETERIRQINAAAKAAAARFKAAYDTAMETAIVAEKEKDRKSLWFNGMWPGSVKSLEDSWAKPDYVPRVKVEQQTWQNTLRALQKDPELQLVVPDPETKSFNPVQLDEKGNLIPFPVGTNAPPAATATGSTNNPAALGSTAKTPAATSGTITNAPTGSDILYGGMFGPLYRTAPPETATTNAASIGIAPPAKDGALNPPPTPAVPSVRHMFGPNHDILLMPEDSAILLRELPHVANKEEAYAAIIDQFVKAGRTKIVPIIGARYAPLTPADSMPNRPPF